MGFASILPPVSNRHSRSPFFASRAKIVALNVVYDSAKRTVKLSSDYLDAARPEQHYQTIMQVVETDRKQMRSFLKKRQSNGYDHDLGRFTYNDIKIVSV